MDPDVFVTKFNPESSGITEIVRQHLLQGVEQTKKIRVELYKLDVYDTGSFFKPHQDTPRSEKMFASLVVVFPTPHEGGDLLLRHDGEEWSFRSSQILAQCTAPSAAFVAFYSDVEHEVTPVESGYRLTLTYNLYYADDQSPQPIPLNPNSITPSLPDSYLLTVTLANLLQDPYCLPHGGFFGFGLRFSYPILSRKGIRLRDIIKHLKGSDATLRMVCESLSLATSLQLVIVNEGRWTYHDVLLPETVDVSHYEQENEMAWDMILASHNPIRIYDVDDEDGNPPENAEPVIWITPKTEYRTYEGQYVRYGNDASTIGHMYGDVCLMVEVGPYHQRETL
ncbi:hypothetical protein BDN72DRAFT_848213 [Pluteus cervinus]|uniref:Uncharacterized protein n=1 Tax=Pluteus cervinus TaxID=181527 RepID=A0ACD3ABG0_9AGAR|nr:hypothetical protein BDN72DRAFT_848213 [Pluteus cervinus]